MKAMLKIIKTGYIKCLFEDVGFSIRTVELKLMNYIRTGTFAEFKDQTKTTFNSSFEFSLFFL